MSWTQGSELGIEHSLDSVISELFSSLNGSVLSWCFPGAFPVLFRECWRAHPQSI